MLETKIPESSPNRKIIGIIAAAFFITFVLSRLVVYLVSGNYLPNLFLFVKGVHIHHFTYGVVILVIDGLYFILKRPKPETRKFLLVTLFYGIGLGLTFDEFGMWIRLEDDYWVRQSYDAIVIILLLLFNIAFYSSVKKVLIKEFSHLVRLFKYTIGKILH